MSYQVANTLNPNSKYNTVVFSYFEAKDYRTNLRIALLPFKEQINKLQQSKWRYNIVHDS